MDYSIVVEGMDGTGKSTLVAELVKRYGLKLLESGGPPADPYDLMKWCKLQYVSAVAGGFALDRVSCISQRCYNDLDLWTDQFLAHEMQSMYDTHKVIFIYCRPCMETVLDLSNHEVKERDSQELLDYIHNNAAKILSKYDRIMDLGNVICYDYEYDSLDSLHTHLNVTSMGQLQ